MNSTNDTNFDHATKLIMLQNDNRTKSESKCEEPQDFNTINDFLVCFVHFANENVPKTIFGFSLVFGIIVANTYVIVMVLIRSKVLNVFDQIMIGHSLV
jgi:hypothetical protein